MKGKLKLNPPPVVAKLRKLKAKRKANEGNQIFMEDTVMNKKALLISEIGKLPESIVDEVSDFVHFLLLKKNFQKLETAIASETSLKKYWLKSEEDDAWQDL